MQNTIPSDVESRLLALDVYKSYKNAQYESIKHSSYFQVYEELFSKYRNKKITFVEIGVLNGGSLFMWRDYFGPEARIIGVEFNPGAKKWEADGFEIYIGSQSDPEFWDNLFASVGDVDIVLDDGGHTNQQQIITALKCVPHIKNEGMLVTEDTHTSYFENFGNPSKYSFINYSKNLVDGINSRFPGVYASRNILKNAVYSVCFYESIVCFNIDRRKCFVSTETSNDGIKLSAIDFRHHGDLSHKASNYLRSKFKKIGLRFSGNTLFSYLETKWINHSLKKYFD